MSRSLDRHGLVLAAVCAVGLAGAACGDDPTTPAPGNPFPPAPDDTLPYVYAPPQATGDGWSVGTLADVGLSEERFTTLIDLMRAGIYPNMHGLVVVKDGLLVLEEYLNGLVFEAAIGDSIVGTWTSFDRSTAHNLASVPKSGTPLLGGSAGRDGANARTRCGCSTCSR